MDEINAIAARHGTARHRRRRPELRRRLQGQAELQPVHHRLHELLSRASRWAATATAARSSPVTTTGQGHARDPRARPGEALRPHPHRRRRPHGYAAVRRRARQARALRLGSRAARRDWCALQRSCSPASRRAVRTLALRPDRTSVYAQYTIAVADRQALQDGLRARGIPTAVHYPVPLHRQPAYAGTGAARPLPVSERLAAEVMSLPMHPDLDESTQGAIVAAVREVAAGGGKAARERLTGSC